MRTFALTLCATDLNTKGKNHMAKEDTSTVRDNEISVKNVPNPKPTASGPKLTRELDRFAEASRDGKGG
jgi:hypothetical protein